MNLKKSIGPKFTTDVRINDNDDDDEIADNDDKARADDDDDDDDDDGALVDGIDNDGDGN